MRCMMGDDDNLTAALRLNHAAGVGPVLYRRLVRMFGGPAAVLAAPPARLAEIEDVGPKVIRGIREAGDDPWAEKELAQVRRAEYRILLLDGPDYPPALLKTYDPPPVLYVHGSLKPEDAVAVAIVGTRRCSRYGRKRAEELAAGLAAAGCTVVSGLARGIDTIAHQGALSVPGGRTICVLGNGLGKIYPAENRTLYETIVAGHGAAVSELPVNTNPDASNFPRRNRIIAGLTLGTIVVEGDAGSGALITARCAVDMDREVFAVPGTVDSPGSRGPHRLIKAGAKLVEDVSDVLEELRPMVEPLVKLPAPDQRLRKPRARSASADQAPLLSGSKTEPPDTADARPTAAELRTVTPGSLSERERKIFLLLDIAVPRNVDELIRESGFPAQEVLGILLVLEVRRLCRQLPGKRFLKES